MTERVDVAALRALEAKATPAPWNDACNKIGADGAGIAEVDFDSDDDRALVIHLRNAAPSLLAEVEDWRDCAKAAADEKCDANGVHCTCVPLLREEVAALKCRAEAAEDAVASWVSSERDENARMREDAEKYRWCIEHAAWHRSTDAAHVAIPVHQASNLSCAAFRDLAIESAMRESAALAPQGEKEARDGR